MRRPNNARNVVGYGRVIASLIDTPLGKMTREQAAVCFEIPKASLIRRIWKKWPMDRAFGPNLRPRGRIKPPLRGSKAKYTTAWGRVPIKVIAWKMGMSRQALQHRIYGGWPLEEAFNTPPFGVRGKHFIMPPEEYRARVAEHLANDRRERTERPLHEDLREVESGSAPGHGQEQQAAA